MQFTQLELVELLDRLLSYEDRTERENNVIKELRNELCGTDQWDCD